MGTHSHSRNRTHPHTAFDAAGTFKSEKAAWEATTHEWALDGAEAEALAVLKRRLAQQ